MLHYQLPSVTTTLSFTNDVNSMSFAIELDCAALSKWGSWKAQAKSYMQGKQTIALMDAVESYTSAIQGLYDWLFSQAKEAVQSTAIHKLDLQTELAQLSRSETE